MSEAWTTVVQAAYLFAPLLLASALTGLVMRFDLFPWLKRPLDGGRSLGGRRIFGDNKTWRGLVFPICGTIIGVLLQKHVVGSRAANLAVVHYESINGVLFGAAMGAGAMLGELPNSFLKRRLGIGPGTGSSGLVGAMIWAWDQVDLLIVTWPMILPWLWPGWVLVATSFVLVGIIHPMVSVVGYLAGARRTAR